MAGLKKSECGKVIDVLGGTAGKQLKSVGKFTIPGVCMVKTRKKAATPAGKREVFGKVVMVKAKPAKTVVKAYTVAALKKMFWGSCDGAVQSRCCGDVHGARLGVRR